MAQTLFVAWSAATVAGQQPAPGADVAVVEAQEPVAPPEWVGGQPWWRWSRVTGDWAGHRLWLEERGVEVGGGLTMDWAAVWSGGLRHRDTVLYLLDGNVAVDLDTLLGIPRTLVFADAYSVQGRDPSEDAGDIQGFTNLQAPDTDQLTEAWVETHFGEAIRVKIGKVDYNSEFAFSEEGGEFVHPSSGITPTIVGAPTYPNAATSVNLFFAPSETFYVGVGVFDGAGADGIRTGRHGFQGFFASSQSDAYLTNLEVGAAWIGGDTWGSGRLCLGGWHHSGTFDRFDGGRERGTSGMYVVFDQRLHRENPACADDPQGIGLVLAGGLADEDVQAVAAHALAGVTWTGLVDGRDDDAAGLMITHAILSGDPAAGFARDETAIELFYKLQLTPALAIKPDVQWIVDPSGDPTIGDALVGLLRFELTF